MWRAFWEVIGELWLFAIGKDGETTPPHTVKQSAPSEATAPQQNVKPFDKSEAYFGVAYVTSLKVELWQEEQTTFDGVLTSLNYGDRVVVKRIIADKALVSFGALTGWVLQSDLSDDGLHVFPNLKPGFIYTARNQETIRLRNCIQDAASGGYLNMLLQPLEYILYQLKTYNHQIDWPAGSVRNVGSIHAVLRSNRFVRISVEPHTGDVIESTDEDNPLLGYIEAVHPDNSILVSSVGRVTEGEFRRETFSHEKWREWRPVFLTFS